MAKSYYYAGLEASLYDPLDELSDFEDLGFYQWFAEAIPGPVLDVGCGTGRIMKPLLERGLEVVGLDNAPEMLEQCRSKLAATGLRGELVQAEMQEFDLGERRFGTILVPGFSVQLLAEDTEIDGLLTSCRRHLRPDGQLVLPTHLPWEMIWDGREECPLEEKVTVAQEGTQEVLAAFQGWRIDTREQRLLLRNRYERRRANGAVIEAEEKEMTLRWHLPHEMLERLGRLGFGDVSVYGDFGFEPADEESESIVYLARI